MGRRAYKLDKKAILQDYATHNLRYVYEKHGGKFISPGSFATSIHKRGITKKKAKAYVERLKAQTTVNLEKELAKPPVWQRIASFFGGHYAA